MDGGLGQLLCGTKEGQFSPVAVGTSGFAVSGDAKSLAASDINGDGRPGLLVGVNDAPTWLLYILPPSVSKWIRITRRFRISPRCPMGGGGGLGSSRGGKVSE